MHPGYDGAHGIWTVRRWTSTVSGPIQIVANPVRGTSQGSGTGVDVIVDGLTLYSTVLGGSSPVSATISLAADVHVGSTVDFVITPPPNLDISYDATSFEATILQAE